MVNLLCAAFAKGLFQSVACYRHAAKLQKKSAPQAFARVADSWSIAIFGQDVKNFFVALRHRYLLILFNGLRRSRMERRENVKKESPISI